jgi:hypothetical protein
MIQLFGRLTTCGIAAEIERSGYEQGSGRHWWSMSVAAASRTCQPHLEDMDDLSELLRHFI